MKVILAGATGLVGRCVLQQVLQESDLEIVYAISRRGHFSENPKMQWVFGPEVPESLPAADVLVIALGTTMAVAGTKERFWMVDVDLPVSFAKAARASGCERVILVSAKGANAESRIFYNRAKGALENQLKDMKFKGLTILRPSLLLGYRKESRPMESFTQSLVKPIRKFFPKTIRPVEGVEVARMICRSLHFEGFQVFENEAFVG